jgi:NAD(P)-dependent dehydrogenase (short-subunit alcohol dehydrogenase family)
VAPQLLHHGFTITVIGQDPDRGADAARRIGGDTRFLQADLSSCSRSGELGARLAEEGPLQLLVNNVVGMWSTRRETPDGIEASFALNHLSPVVLTEALLDALRAGAPSRIVDVTSSSITTVLDGAPTYDDVEQDGEYVGTAGPSSRTRTSSTVWTSSSTRRSSCTASRAPARPSCAAAQHRRRGPRLPLGDRRACRRRRQPRRPTGQHRYSD